MLNIKREDISRGVTLFPTVIETALGGFTLDKTTLADGIKVLKGGTVIGYDETVRKAVVLKTARLQAGVTDSATDYPVKKGHGFKVGDIVAATLKSKAYAITAIDTSATDFDRITLATTLGVTLPAETGLFQAKTTGATAAAFFTQPKGLLFNDTEIEPNTAIDVVIRGTVYARRIPVVTAEIQLAMPLIVFSQSR